VRPTVLEELWGHLVQVFGEKRGRGVDGWAKAQPGMGAGKEVSSMGGGMGSTLFDLEL
jgi:hypothetical protein